MKLVPEISEGAYHEHVCKIKKCARPIDYDKYVFYNKKKSMRALTFCHRAVSNVFLRAYLKCFHRVKVVGRENLRGLKHTGVVVVSNHVHTLDIQMISTFLFGMRRVHWLTLARNFDLNLRFFIRNSGGVPIPEDHDNKKRCFSEMQQMLKENGVLHICPEGSLVDLCGTIRPFKVGAFRFAAENQVPLLPVTLRFEEKNKKGKPYKFPRFIIDVAPPIYADAAALQPAEELMNRAHGVMYDRCNAKRKAIKE